MGLLDGLFSDDPKQQAMMAMAMGLLGNQSGNFGHDVGKAGLLGQQAYAVGNERKQKAMQEEQQRQLRDMQMAQMKQAMDDQKFAQQQAPQFFSLGNAPADGTGPVMPPKADLSGYGMALAQRNPQMGMPFIQAGMKDTTPMKVGKNDRLVDPQTRKEILPAMPDLPAGMVMGPNGPEYMPAYLKGQQDIRAAGRPQVTTNVNTDKTYAGHIASGLASQDVAVIDAAKSAPERLQSARQVKDILAKNPITGTGAEARLALSKALSTAGLVGNERVADTETLASLLASQTLDAIKTSGLGSGQGFTDKDRQFLERARSGNIEINPDTLRQLALINERAALVSINKGNQVIKKLKANPNMGGVGLSLDEIPSPAAPAPAAKGGLTAAEQAEYEQLKAWLNGRR